jgi:hypothetical protein
VVALNPVMTISALARLMTTTTELPMEAAVMDLLNPHQANHLLNVSYTLILAKRTPFHTKMVKEQLTLLHKFLPQEKLNMKLFSMHPINPGVLLIAEVRLKNYSSGFLCKHHQPIIPVITIQMEHGNAMKKTSGSGMKWDQMKKIAQNHCMM